MFYIDTFFMLFLESTKIRKYRKGEKYRRHFHYESGFPPQAPEFLFCLDTKKESKKVGVSTTSRGHLVLLRKKNTGNLSLQGAIEGSGGRAFLPFILLFFCRTAAFYPTGRGI